MPLKWWHGTTVIMVISTHLEYHQSAVFILLFLDNEVQFLSLYGVYEATRLPGNPRKRLLVVVPTWHDTFSACGPCSKAPEISSHHAQINKEYILLWCSSRRKSCQILSSEGTPTLSGRKRLRPTTTFLSRVLFTGAFSSNKEMLQLQQPRHCSLYT